MRTSVWAWLAPGNSLCHYLCHKVEPVDLYPVLAVLKLELLYSYAGTINARIFSLQGRKRLGSAKE